MTSLRVLGPEIRYFVSFQFWPYKGLERPWLCVLGIEHMHNYISRTPRKYGILYIM